MNQDTSAPFITQQGHQNAKNALLYNLTVDHFKRVPEACFVVVGKSSRASLDKICAHISELLGIPNKPQSRIKFFQRGQGLQLEDMISASSTPGCIGVVISGVTEKQLLSIEGLLKSSNVWSDEYVVVSGHKSIKSLELEAQLRKMLEFYFEEELQAVL